MNEEILAEGKISVDGCELEARVLIKGREFRVGLLWREWRN